MSKTEHVLYIPSFDGTPKVQAEVSELWRPYDVRVESRASVVTDDNYEEWLEETGEEIDELARETKVYVVGASGGGKSALSLLIRHPDSVHRIVIINTKIDPYNFHNPETRKKLPNLAKTSDVLQDDMPRMTMEMRNRTLSLRSRNDEILDGPDDAVLYGGNNVVIPVETHADGISFAVTRCGMQIVRFCRQGTVPTSV